MEFIVKIYCLSKVNSVYHFGGLDYLPIAGVTKTMMLEPSLQVRTEAICRLSSSSHEYYFFSETSFKDEEVLVSVCYS